MGWHWFLVPDFCDDGLEADFSWVGTVDYAAANAVVECTHRYKNLFYDAEEEA